MINVFFTRLGRLLQYIGLGNGILVLLGEATFSNVRSILLLHRRHKRRYLWINEAQEKSHDKGASAFPCPSVALGILCENHKSRIK